MDNLKIQAMNKYVLATNIEVILILISCLGSSASAQPMTQSANTSMSGSNNTTTSSSINMTISQAAQALLNVCGPGPVCVFTTTTTTTPTPGFVRVNDTFGFKVDVFNGSPKPITVQAFCNGPLTAKFDNHYVTVKNYPCNILGLPRSIPPHTTATVYGPPFRTVYEAIRSTGLLPGYTPVVLAFTYQTPLFPGLHHIYWTYPLHIWP
jgi:hypothetical protein